MLRLLASPGVSAPQAWVALFGRSRLVIFGETILNRQPDQSALAEPGSDQGRQSFDNLGPPRGRVASTVIEEPGAAASIIRPMIEVPPTVSLQRRTHRTSASNFSTVCTNLADARGVQAFLVADGQNTDDGPRRAPVL